MVFNFYFTETARKDLDSTLDYITNELCSPIAAQNFGQKVFESIKNVCTYPDSGMILKNSFIKDTSIRKVLIDNYTLYYKKSDQTIYILRIVYSKRDLNEVVKQFINK